MKRITIQGIAGCFHETAAHGSFPGEEVEVLPCVSFDEQFACMAADPELLGVAAIENTIAGSLLPNHELLRRSTLTVIGEYKLRISHVLAALPGQRVTDIREVHSHPIALMQCGEYLKARPAMKVVERDDTAGSAREIAGQRLAGTAAICGANSSTRTIIAAAMAHVIFMAVYITSFARSNLDAPRFWAIIVVAPLAMAEMNSWQMSLILMATPLPAETSTPY